MQTRRTDPIMAEVLTILRAATGRLAYDIEAISSDIGARHEASGRDFVRLSARWAGFASRDRGRP